MTVRWTKRAATHLESIYRHIARDKPEAVRALVADLFAATEILTQHAGIGRRGRRSGTRELVRPPYLIVYHVKGDVVSIDAVIHGSRK